MALHGYTPDQYQEAMALPNATTGYSNDFLWKGATGGKLRLLVIANTAISIATDKILCIEFMAGATANPTVNPKAETHTSFINHTTADGVLTYTAGEIMVDYVLPEGILVSTDLYFRLLFTTDGDESAEKVDILVVGW
jgi:hypothetical protein